MKDFKARVPDYSKLLVIVFPCPMEAAHETANINIKMKERMQQLLGRLKSKNIDTLSLYPKFEALINEDNLYQYTFHHDGHFNPNGYLRFAEFIAPTADSLLKVGN